MSLLNDDRWTGMDESDCDIAARTLAKESRELLKRFVGTDETAQQRAQAYATLALAYEVRALRMSLDEMYDARELNSRNAAD